MAGLGYFVAGDAAVVLDPAASHGVLRAIMSGMMAARSAARMRQDPTSEGAIAQQYDHWLRSWFVADADRLRALYRNHPNPPSWLAAASHAP
jgi:flavin-dependent dehydrogenase